MFSNGLSLMFVSHGTNVLFQFSIFYPKKMQFFEFLDEKNQNLPARVLEKRVAQSNKRCAVEIAESIVVYLRNKNLRVLYGYRGSIIMVLIYEIKFTILIYIRGCIFYYLVALKTLGKYSTDNNTIDEITGFVLFEHLIIKQLPRFCKWWWSRKGTTEL